jgi:hypothetical protein
VCGERRTLRLRGPVTGTQQPEAHGVPS